MAEKTQKMIFGEDKFYNNPNEPIYLKGMVYDVPSSMVDRWLKRGGQLVGDKAAPKKEEVPQDQQPAKGAEEVEQDKKSEDHLSHAEEPKHGQEPQKPKSKPQNKNKNKHK